MAELIKHKKNNGMVVKRLGMYQVIMQNMNPHIRCQL